MIELHHKKDVQLLQKYNINELIYSDGWNVKYDDHLTVWD